MATPKQTAAAKPDTKPDPKPAVEQNDPAREIADLKEQLAAKTDRIAELESQLTEATAGINALQARLDEADKDLSEAKNRILISDQMSEDLKKENTTQQARILELESQLAEAAHNQPTEPTGAQGVDLDVLAKAILGAKSFEAASKVEGVFKLVETEKSYIVITIDGQRQEIGK